MLCKQCTSHIFRASKNFRKALTYVFSFLLDLLTISPHAPTPEPVRFDKKDGQWYTHDGVDIKETQQRIGIFSIM